MQIFDKVKNIFKTKNEVAAGTTYEELNRFFNRPATAFVAGSDIGDATYYTCLKTLSEAIGKMPCYMQDGDYNRVRNSDLARMLEWSPNARQTAAEFFSYIEYQRNHYGNGYAYVHWLPSGKLEGIYPLDAQFVRVLVNNTGEATEHKYYYEYSKNGGTVRFSPDEILHVKSWLLSSDGYVGLSVRDILRGYLDGSKAAQVFQNNLFQNGLQANLAVKYTSDMNKAQKRQVIEDMKDIDTGYKDRIMLLPPGWDVQTLDLKVTDTDFFNLRKYSALQIAAAFGIKPNTLNNYEKSSYSNSAAQNLSFYTDTLLYIITLYEQEFSRKLLSDNELKAGLAIKFNYNVLLRADPAAQAEMLAKYVTGSIYTVNEARQKAGLPPVENGDNIVMASGYSTLNKVMNPGEVNEK